jgi:phosphatidate phosphatase APP1
VACDSIADKCLRVCLNLIMARRIRSTSESSQPRPRRFARLRKPRSPRVRKIMIDVYDGYGRTDFFEVSGRLYSERRVDEVNETDSRLRNLVNTSKRFMINDAEQVWIEVTVQGRVHEVLSDAQGRFCVAFDAGDALSPGPSPVAVKLSSRNQKRMQAEIGTAMLILHEPHSNRVGIISDIDDTVLITQATSKVKLLSNTFLRNYLTQQEVPGMSTLYRAIHYGPQGDGYDATHFVSSSPSHLYRRINQFLQYRQFPEGSIDLKRIGLGKTADSLFDHEGYKLGKIRRIFETFPKRRYVLFGDSGEHDPEIYRQIAQEYPGRVVGVYIHNVTGEDPYNARFNGQVLFSSVGRIRADLIARGLIAPAQVPETEL